MKTNEGTISNPKCHLCDTRKEKFDFGESWLGGDKCTCLACYLRIPSGAGKGHEIFGSSEKEFLDVARYMLQPRYDRGKFRSNALRN